MDRLQSIEMRLDAGIDSKPGSAVTVKLDDMSKRFESLVNRLQAIEVRLNTKVDPSQSKAEGRDLQIFEEVHQRLEHTVDQLRTNMVEPVALAVQDALQQDKAEELEIEKRKTNVIIHGLAESQDDSSDYRISDDLAASQAAR